MSSFEANDVCPRYSHSHRNILYFHGTLGQPDANNIKLESSSVIGLTFLSLLVELELDVICTFPKGPDLLTGSSGADSSVDPMGEDASRCGYQGSSWPTSSASCVLQNSHCMQ